MSYDDYLNSEHWRRLRARKFAEVGEACQECGDRASSLHVHHLTYARKGYELLSDLQVLCEDCHARTHGLIPRSGRSVAVISAISALTTVVSGEEVEAMLREYG